MKVIDPGHTYELNTLDGDGTPQLLQFVKREGVNYPGNVGTSAGTTTQEVLRALIDRTEYVNAQIPCPENECLQQLLRTAVWLLESRAAARHKRQLPTVQQAVYGATCDDCGHTTCPGRFRR